MLDKRRPLDEHNVSTIIGPGTKIKGEIHSKGTVRVEGEVEGRIECEDTVSVHESGTVKADIVGGQVIISGTVEGNTFAHERLEITNQAKVIGNITAPRISIAEGVIFEGQCTMKAPGQAHQPKREPAKQPEPMPATQQQQHKAAS
jgi:cytoskeletal protein CcmA (bactofilin family)